MSKQNKMPYNCREATFLIEKQNLSTISIRQQHKLQLHLDACFVCEVFQQQSFLIDKMFKDHFFSKDAELPKLDEKFKESLENRIVSELKKID